MKKRISILVAGLSLLFGGLSPALCANLTGVVTNLQGQPVSGMQIVVQNPAKQVLGKAITNASGHYEVGSLSPNTYAYTLNPMNTGYKGGSAISYCGSKGLIINWKVSNNRGALAMAAPGGTGGLTGWEVASTVVLGAAVLGGAAVGAYGAAGGFSGNSNSTPSSSSM
jgi:hypothetical protein